MKRIVCCLCLALFALGGEHSWGAAPPMGARNLSLREASRRALEYAGFCLHELDGTWRVSLPGVNVLEAERKAAQILLNAEVAYWNLYGARQKVSAMNQAVAATREALHACETRRDLGRATDAEVRLAQKQYNLARKDAGKASEWVRESERQLRSMMGMSLGAGHLIPGDAPKMSFVCPDMKAAVKEAMACRVELRLTRNEVRSFQALVSMDQTSQGERSITSSDARVRLARAVKTLKDQEEKALRLPRPIVPRIDRVP